MSVTPLSDDAALAGLVGRLAAAPFIALDTEFLRERTYRPQLCLIQVATPDEAHCVDPLGSVSLTLMSGVLRDESIQKVLHAARQDLEVLWPVFGSVAPVFDTQIAAALAGMPAQIGYSELVRRLLGVDLDKAETRTDWSKRPLSDAQLRYAIDDVKYLGALRDDLAEKLARLGRTAWLEEELRDLANPQRLFVDPERAGERLRWSGELDPDRARLAQQLAAWRERRAAERDRPRTWILEDAGLRSIVLRVPRNMDDLRQLTDLTPGFVERSGDAVLQVVAGADMPRDLPPPAGRARPDPEHLARVKRLSAVIQQVGTELGLSPEILATRRDLEAFARGARELDMCQGWRDALVRAPLLAAL